MKAEYTLGPIALIVLIAVLYVIGAVSGAIKCNVRWGDRAEYWIFGGCMVSTSEGFIPEDRYRVVE